MSEGVPVRVRARRWHGYTLVEVILAVALALGIIGFGFQVLRFFTLRTTSTTRAAGDAKAYGIFLERLRRTLRMGVQVRRTPRGFVVAHVVNAEGEYSYALTTFEVDDDGMLLITLPSGRVIRLPIEGGVPALSIRELGPGRIEVRVGEVVVVVQSLLERERSLIGTGGLEEALEKRPLAGWRLEEGEVERGGEARVEASGGSLPGLEELGGVLSGAGTLEGGLDLEADTAAAEGRPIGRIFLPVELPPGLRGTDLRDLIQEFTARGIDEARAAELAGLLQAWEVGVLGRARRDAAQALSRFDASAQADGLSSAEVIALVGDASRIGAELVRGNPEAVAAGEAGEMDPVRYPPSLIGSPPDFVPGGATPDDPLVPVRPVDASGSFGPRKPGGDPVPDDAGTPVEVPADADALLAAARAAGTLARKEDAEATAKEASAATLGQAARDARALAEQEAAEAAQESAAAAAARAAAQVAAAQAAQAQQARDAAAGQAAASQQAADAVAQQAQAATQGIVDALNQAQGDYDAAQAAADQAARDSQQADRDLAQAQQAEAGAQGDLTAAEGDLQTAEADLVAAEDTLTTADDALTAAEGDLTVAEAEERAALLDRGIAEDQLAMADLQVDDAQVRLAGADDAVTAAEADVERALAFFRQSQQNFQRLQNQEYAACNSNASPPGNPSSAQCQTVRDQRRRAGVIKTNANHDLDDARITLSSVRADRDQKQGALDRAVSTQQSLARIVVQRQAEHQQKLDALEARRAARDAAQAARDRARAARDRVKAARDDAEARRAKAEADLRTAAEERRRSEQAAAAARQEADRKAQEAAAAAAELQRIERESDSTLREWEERERVAREQAARDAAALREAEAALAAADSEAARTRAAADVAAARAATAQREAEAAARTADAAEARFGAASAEARAAREEARLAAERAAALEAAAAEQTAGGGAG